MLIAAAEHESFSVSGELSIEKEYVLKLMENHPSIFYKLSKPLQQDPQILELAVSKKCRVLQYAPDSFRKDREFVLKCVRNFRNELKFADRKFFNDVEIVYESLKNRTMEHVEQSNLKGIHPELKRTNEFC